MPWLANLTPHPFIRLPAGKRVHPLENIRGSLSGHLAGKTIVLGVCGSIAAVKTVELARELARHGAHVAPVMTEGATRLVGVDAVEFATGVKPITRLTGAVEHVALLGDVPGKADLLLIAPATANTIAKVALGIDDSPVTTCATVAVGTRTPIVVAPAMHDAMLSHPIVAEHAATLRDRLGVTWVEPEHDEKKAKLADIESIVESVIHRLAADPGPTGTPGPLAGKRCLVISGATAEPLDDVRILTNGTSGASGHILATELRRLGATITLWQGHATRPVPSALEPFTTHFGTHDQLLKLAATKATHGRFDQVWMPAAIGDFAPRRQTGKLPSDAKGLRMELVPLSKVILTMRRHHPQAILVGFKAEADADKLLERAASRRNTYGADYVVANHAASFGADDTEVHLLGPAGTRTFAGPKTRVLPLVVEAVAADTAKPSQAARRTGARRAKAATPSGKPPRRAKAAAKRLTQAPPRGR